MPALGEARPEPCSPLLRPEAHQRVNSNSQRNTSPIVIVSSGVDAIKPVRERGPVALVQRHPFPGSKKGPVALDLQE